MAIIFNFCALTASIICLSATYRLRRSYYQTKIEILKAYSNGFFCVGLAYIILALPGFVLFNPFWIQIDFILVDISFLMAILFFGPAIFGLSEKLRPFRKSIFFLILFWILIYTFLNVVFFSPAIHLMENNLVYFWKTGTPWLQSIARGLLVIAVLSMTVFFFRWAIISAEKKIVYRSFFIGLGALSVAIAGSILWFLPFFYFSLSSLIFSGILGLLGFTIAIISILLF